MNLPPVTIKCDYWRKRYLPCGYNGVGELVCNVEWLHPCGELCRTTTEHVTRKKYDEMKARQG